jgi:hypothetical protein
MSSPLLAAAASDEELTDDVDDAMRRRDSTISVAVSVGLCTRACVCDRHALQSASSAVSNAGVMRVALVVRVEHSAFTLPVVWERVSTAKRADDAGDDGDDDDDGVSGDFDPKRTSGGVRANEAKVSFTLMQVSTSMIMVRRRFSVTHAMCVACDGCRRTVTRDCTTTGWWRGACKH